MLDESNEQQCFSPPFQSYPDESQLGLSSRKRRKTLLQSKSSTSSSSTATAAARPSSSTNVPMILNLIDSLVDERQLDSDCDENLLVTIDSLISSLKHLREKIKTIHHDDAHPLNLTKPKSKPQQQHTRPSSNNAEERQSMRHSPSPATFQLPSPIFSGQPFFSPFSGKSFPSTIDL